MKIMIICPTDFYEKVEEMKLLLEENGIEVEVPNCYSDPITNDDYEMMKEEEYLEFFKKMYQESREKISKVDAVFVLNFDKKRGEVFYQNYIGASTFLEMYEAFMQNKKIYLYHDFPDYKNILLDEIKGFHPIIIKEDLNKIIEDMKESN